MREVNPDAKNEIGDMAATAHCLHDIKSYLPYVKPKLFCCFDFVKTC